jgi:hypothetical protein
MSPPKGLDAGVQSDGMDAATALRGYAVHGCVLEAAYEFDSAPAVGQLCTCRWDRVVGFGCQLEENEHMYNFMSY